MASTVGIKIANGEFYSIVEENTDARKRLILTTVHDDQQSMQIDLYRSQLQSMTDSQYIGSIVVENIKAKQKGEPSVELIISSSSAGTLSANAMDLDASSKGEHLHLSVSLKSLEWDTRDYTIPNFELEPTEPPPQGLYDRAARMRKQEKSKKAPLVPIIIIGCVIILAGLSLWFFLFRGNGASRPETPAVVEQPAPQPVEPPPPPPAPARTEPPLPVEPPPPPPPPVKVIEASAPEPARPAQPAARRTRPAAPVASYKVPAVIPREGAAYRIRWGDTLWDISEAFYRNPWLYPRIARFNRIRNPDLIISGTTIRIPPRN
jgi:hypothetical protein